MEEREFEWDEEKNAANIRKHGIAFEEAVYAFLDPIHAEIYDWNHSTCLEERWIAYGLSTGF
ncbi:hypothetical protein FACS189473_3870 [Spirochaetia bacterium]|nr:hypothetical protein FACS189473_3870 [Spirochaetia bacterium]